MLAEVAQTLHRHERRRLKFGHLALANLLLLSIAHRICARGAKNFDAQELIMEGYLKSPQQQLADLQPRVVLNLLALLTTKYGIPAARLSIQSYGSNQPLSPNDTPAGRAANRRVEILILDDRVSRPRTIHALRIVPWRCSRTSRSQLCIATILVHVADAGVNIAGRAKQLLSQKLRID